MTLCQSPTVYKYSRKSLKFCETNLMQFLFSLLRINVLYMFRALLAHPQETLHKRHLIYYMRVMSVGCIRMEVKLTSSASILVT
jgi:hypothetical protein